MSFLPTDYKVPETGNYMKLRQGKNVFRALGDAVIGWEYWNRENKPVRSHEPLDEVPDDIKLDTNGIPTMVKHFWAFPVWNYAAKRVQILEITQSTIQSDIEGLYNDEDWSDPKGYDISITRVGNDMQSTKYNTNPKPKSPIAPNIVEEYDKKSPNMEALFTGNDPFKS